MRILSRLLHALRTRRLWRSSGAKGYPREPEGFLDEGLCNEAHDMIAAEDDAQQRKWGPQSHTLPVWMLILMEEAGELSKEILEYRRGYGSLKAIVKEAAQVATVALKIAWMARKKGGDARARHKNEA